MPNLMQFEVQATRITDRFPIRVASPHSGYTSVTVGAQLVPYFS